MKVKERQKMGLEMRIRTGVKNSGLKPSYQ